MDWKRNTVGNGKAEYHGQIGAYSGTKATATVYRVGAKWTATANVEGKTYAVDTFGWFKTAKEAMRTVAMLCEAQIAHNAKEEREAGYPKAKAHAAKAGAEFAKAVMACKGRGYDVMALEGRNGVAARRSFRSHAPYGSCDMWTAYLAEWELHYRAALRCRASWLPDRKGVSAMAINRKPGSVSAHWSTSHTRSDCSRDNVRVICPNSSRLGYSRYYTKRGFWISAQGEGHPDFRGVGRVLGRVRCEGKTYVEAMMFFGATMTPVLRWIEPFAVNESYAQPPRSVLQWIMGDWSDPASLVAHAYSGAFGCGLNANKES